MTKEKQFIGMLIANDIPFEYYNKVQDFCSKTIINNSKTLWWCEYRKGDFFYRDCYGLIYNTTNIEKLIEQIIETEAINAC